MVRYIGVLLFLSLGIIGSLFADIKLNGAIRNDSIVINRTNYTSYNNILEGKLNFRSQAEEWKFFADARFYLYYGEITNYLGGGFGLNLMRFYAQYYTPIGDFTVGKDYVNFGNTGIFNPFEMNKNLNFTDLNYDKDGILGFRYDFYFGDISGDKVYISPAGDITNSAYGFAIYANIPSLNVGLVANRKAIGQNILGLYLKGDLELGVAASYAFHFDDYWTNNFMEATVGLDYSFFAGKLILSANFYYVDIGAERTNDYNPYKIIDKYFNAKYYLYGNVSFAPDEFLSLSADVFANLVDGSLLLIPSVRYTLSDGLFITAMADFIFGKGSQEFSADTLGNWSAILRFEGRM